MKHLPWLRAVDVKPFLFASLAVVALGGVARPAAAAVVMQEFASPAPNVFGSPSYPGWVANTVTAFDNGLSSVGDPATDPAAYFRVTKGTDTSNIVTGFPSWQGLASPVGAFASELGNRLHFPLLVNGNGALVSLSELSFNMHSSDPGNILGFTGNFAAGVYDTEHVGINFGGNGVLGGGDDTFVTSGSASQLVNAFVYRGPGNALAPNDPGVNCATGTNQAQIDCVRALYDSIMPFGLTTDYTLTGAPGGLVTTSATVQFGVPEPASLLLLGSALVVLGVGRRRWAR